ncbi:MAG: UDP-N-acetylmuramoyl-tripeptide--D-alanyl-D-alanine ligase [Desulfovibrio sp.]|nr:UDP-N-acetylmuramoyl-tripeptide--D-alanyl-D-alanine ligase [Desulfovibrio sp.]
MRLSYEELCGILGYTRPDSEKDTGNDVFVTSVFYDSREVQDGALFVCIKGETNDGHDYAEKAMEKGARVLLVERKLPLSLPQIVVKNSIEALGRVAHAWRKRTRAKVIGITGTCGKTTLKDMIAHVLSSSGKTAKSLRNHNNQLGMASGMLNTDGDEDFWVFELGISHPNDMDELASILEPDIGVILNVGAGHTEGLGDMGVAWYKTRLLLHLAQDGKGLVCADYPELVWKAMGTHVSPLYFFSGKEGVVDQTADKADISQSSSFAYWLSDTPEGKGRYRVFCEGTYHDIVAPVCGAYGAENVMATVLVARLLGLSIDCVIKSLPDLSLPEQRFNRKDLGSYHIIDDTYNANPLSMQRMLDAAKNIACDRPLILVLGEMRELGKESSHFHQQLGAHLAALMPKAIFWKGGEGDAVKKGYLQKGGAAPFIPVDDADDFITRFIDLEKEGLISSQGATLLFKGSRANQLEKLIASFEKAVEKGAGHVL